MLTNGLRETGRHFTPNPAILKVLVVTPQCLSLRFAVMLIASQMCLRVTLSGNYRLFKARPRQHAGR